MKVRNNDDEITIYLNDYYAEKFDFSSIDLLEDTLNDLFIKLKKIYNIKLNGYYNIDIYVDNNYGAIIYMKKEEIEYYDYFKDQIDTQIIIHSDSNFLYRIADFCEIKDYLKVNYSLYKYNNELYIRLNDKLDKINFINMLEYCTEICYDIEKIVKSNNLLFCNK